jgi:effector-binding domain-containing protein
MFLPSSLKLDKNFIVDNDEEVIRKQFREFELKELLGYEVNDDLVWNFIDTEQGVEITGSLILDFGFNPLKKFTALFNEDEINNELESHLDSLKNYIENLPKIHRVKVEKKFLEQTQWYLSIRDTVNQKGMNNIHGKLYAQINQFMDRNNIVSGASPIVIYHLWTDSIVDIETGIPLIDSIAVNDTLIKLKKISPCNVVTAIHYGPYERLPETYFGINEWMRKNKVFVTGPPWESYITDPAEENNPEKWQTAIFFPVE